MAWLTDPRKWDDAWWAGLSYGARMVWDACLTGPFRTVLPGLCRNVSALTLHDACANRIKRVHLRPTLQDTEDALAEALEPDEDGKVHFVFDSAVRVARIPMAPAYNHADNPNVLTAWYRAWRDIPDCELKFQHIESLRLGVNFAFRDKNGRSTMADKWDATFGQPERAYRDGGKRLKTYVDLRERWVAGRQEVEPPNPQTTLSFSQGSAPAPVAPPAGSGNGVTAPPNGASSPANGERPPQVGNPFQLPPGVE